MSNYELITDIALLGGCAIVVPIISINLLYDSVKTAIKARYALDMISTGENRKKYSEFLQGTFNDAVQDAKIDGLAGLLIGGRKALFKAVRAGRRNFE